MSDSDAIVRVKSLFFDKEEVRRRVDDGTRAALSKAGAFVMTTGRQSMKNAPAGRYSPPGSPPFAHSGKKGALLKRFLYFSFDPSSKSVVVGPTALGRSTVPNVQEFGGSITIRPRRGRNKGKTIRQKYAARPYMGPALEANLDKIPEAFRGCINAT